MQRSAQNPLILDGSMGMELEKRGFHCRLPLWSAWALLEAPDLVLEIYRDYLKAGADILTTATFRCSKYSLEKTGIVDRFAELNRVAVQIARDAISVSRVDREISVAGSIAPLEDCYSPELAPEDSTLEYEHTIHAEMLSEAGADLLLVETQNSRREALIATKAALSTRLPVWTSLMPKSATELFNGDSLLETTREILDLNVDALLVNCCTPRVAAQAFATLRQQFPEARLGVYPNDLEGVVSPELFADWARQLAHKAAIIGGCCGIGPKHIEALIKAVKDKE
jgi:homocysteine S-methyltransferase